MAFKISLPSVFHRWLECQHQHTFGLQFFGKVIGGERLAKTHLGVPQKAWRSIGIFCPDGLVVVKRFVHRIRLLGPHAKGFVVCAAETLAGAQLCQNRLHILGRATHPLQVVFFEPLFNQGRTHIVVGEDRAVIALCHFIEHDGVVFDSSCLQLFCDPKEHIARGLSYLEQALVRCISNGVGVDTGTGNWLRCQDFIDAWLIHHHFHQQQHPPASPLSSPSGEQPFR